MDIAGLLTSAGINIGLCLVLLSLYSVLRKQPSNACVYFGQRLAQLQSKGRDHFSFDRFVPSPRWIVKAWEASEEEILACGGLDAVVFLRIVVCSRRIFSIAAVICIPFVLPLNYFGKEMRHRHIPSESLDVFTIGNVKEGSKWLWAHCLALYVISCSACVLLYFEYKHITKMRLEHIVGSSLNPSYFTILVRAIPSSAEESCSNSVKNFFTRYHASSYLSHQMVYRSGTVQKLMDDASKMIKCTSTEQFGLYLKGCGLCGGAAHSFKVLSSEPESVRSGNEMVNPELRDKECAAALVFFKTRYAALVASQVLQSANPMSWVTDLAPEPHDVYWKNLSIPYRQLWVRRIATLLASIGFMILFILPVTFVQGLLHLEQLQRRFPFLRGVLKSKFMVRLITGYLPSVVLMLFLYAVPPTMMMFSTIEGPISRSGRKKSASVKVLYFLIWNVFFVYVSSAKVLERLGLFSSPKDMTAQLATAVPGQATFFMTYVLTSGWASLASEIMQPYALLCNFVYKYILRKKDEPSNGTLSFPYHTEIPRVLLFGFLGFTYSLMAPLILPFLLVYFFLASLVYRNQILNVYVTNYQSGGQFWPIMHNTTIFSLVLTQVIAIGVFGLKRSTVAAAFTVPLIIFTLLFNEYCRQRFHPAFKDNAAQVLMEMDRKDEQCGSMEAIHKQLPSAYCQFAYTPNILRKAVSLNLCKDGDDVSIRIPEDTNPGSKPAQGNDSRGPSSMEIEELKK
ncbi:CSC1-like protein RXW8 isoform X1 [Rhododendron vialii]|uniref:CSC1-like protein RXW8 isoform X1 n=1 Tax=Rhododendron vialii TaxID=182163 RepID=UPI00265D627F|nr:CSC1-like protein RXW8 isoform X1 [Rhododendron vialii]XP_058221357.1 CSC1-like protein RXW8 isoform X1 [Rhododendron vialii]